MKQSVQVCIEKGCTINRIITNYEQVCSHFALNHEVWSIEKLEMKGNEKMKSINELAHQKAVKSVEDTINQVEQKVQAEVKSLFQNLMIYYVDLLDKKVKFVDKLESVTVNNKQLIQKYVDVLSDVYVLNQSQVENFLKELESRVKFVQNDLSKSLQVLLDYSKSDIELETTIKVEETPQVEEQQQFQQFELQQPQNQPMEYKYKYYDEEEQQPYKDEDFQYQQQNNYYPQQKEEVVEKPQPLRGYKQAEKQQQQYPEQQEKELFQSKQPQFQYVDNSKETNPFLRQQNHDRINFSLPSDNGQYYVDSRKGKPTQYDPADSTYSSEKQDQKQQGPKQKICITGKKFDITISDKHLKYGQRFSIFSCKQFGFAVVDGVFTLNEDAKVKFWFSDQNGNYDIQIGIIQTNFDRSNLKKDNQGKIFMDESGNVWKQDKKRQGSIKIVTNCDYHLQYRAEKRLLMFRRAETAEEYIHIDNGIQGSFRFFVALSNLQVQIK